MTYYAFRARDLTVMYNFATELNKRMVYLSLSSNLRSLIDCTMMPNGDPYPMYGVFRAKTSKQMEMIAETMVKFPDIEMASSSIRGQLCQCPFTTRCANHSFVRDMIIRGGYRLSFSKYVRKETTIHKVTAKASEVINIDDDVAVIEAPKKLAAARKRKVQQCANYPPAKSSTPPTKNNGQALKITASPTKISGPSLQITTPQPKLSVPNARLILIKPPIETKKNATAAAPSFTAHVTTKPLILPKAVAPEAPKSAVPNAAQTTTRAERRSAKAKEADCSVDSGLGESPTSSTSDVEPEEKVTSYGRSTRRTTRQSPSPLREEIPIVPTKYDILDLDLHLCKFENCGVWVRRRQRASHAISHGNEQRFRCSTCKYQSHNANLVRRHVSRTHQNTQATCRDWERDRSFRDHLRVMIAQCYPKPPRSPQKRAVTCHAFLVRDHTPILPKIDTSDYSYQPTYTLEELFQGSS